MAAIEPIRRPPARAFTLIEVLIALGVVIALSAIVLPLTSWALSLRALDSARDGVEGIILQSRAHARLGAQAVEVRLMGDRLEARWFDPTVEIVESEGTFDLISDIEPIDATEIDEHSINEPWARRRLPQEVEALSWEDYRLLQADSDGFEPLGAGFIDEPGDVPLRIAVLLPDGGALVGEPIVLIGPEGGALRVVVDAWTGRPRIDIPPEEELEALEDEVDELSEPPIEEVSDLPSEPRTLEESDS